MRRAAAPRAHGDGLPPRSPRVVGLCQAFKDVQADPACWSPHPLRGAGAGGLFHQRDWVYLCRFLRRQIDRATDAKAPFDPETPFTPTMLLAGLRRNLGGVSESAFHRLAAIFMNRCGFAAADGRLSSLETVSTLRESLADNLDVEDDPNTAAFRHILLLDPTDVEASTDMLFDLGLVSRGAAVLVSLSDFQSDESDLARSAAVAKIKFAAEEGRIVLLTNAAPIASAIFDLVNRRYTKLTTRGRTVHYANIAVGSLSRPCIVHPSFRLIVHVRERCECSFF